MRKRKKGFWKRNTKLVFIMPWPVGLLVLKLYPFAASFIYGFHFYSLFKIASLTGLENYKYILGDRLATKAFTQAFKYVFLVVPLELMFALFIAYILNSKIRRPNFSKIICYTPFTLGGSMFIAVPQRFLFKTEGLVSTMLGMLDIPAFDWLGNPDGAFSVIMLLRVWQFGSPMVTFLAALKGAQEDLYETVTIDRAREWKQFFQITVPLTTPVIFYNFATQLYHKPQEFSDPFIMTQEGLLRSITLVLLLVYNEVLKRNETGLASAIAWLPFLVIMTFVVVAFISQKYWAYYVDEDGGQAYEQERKSTF